PRRDVALERRVESPSVLTEDPLLDPHTRLPEPLEAATIHQRVRVGGGHDYGADAGVDHGVGAGRRRAVMVAGLERAEQRAAARVVPRFAEGPHLGVRRAPGSFVPP